MELHLRLNTAEEIESVSPIAEVSHGKNPRRHCRSAANASSAYADEIKEKQIEYLRILYINSLPEEERNCWLVQACL